MIFWLENYANLSAFEATAWNPRVTDPLAYLSVALTVGPEATKEDCIRFIETGVDLGENLRTILATPTPRVLEYPPVGFVVDVWGDIVKGSPKGRRFSEEFMDFQSAAFILSRTNDNLYIRNKSPLLSQLCRCGWQPEILFPGRASQ